MNRNTVNRFAMQPQVNIQRSKFKRDSTHKTTMSAGQLVPIYVDEVLPGDTHSLDMASIIRMQTPLFPTMDNSFIDYFFFFVPNRLTWEHWQEFNGENTTEPWTQQDTFTIPQLNAPVGGWAIGTIADYMGVHIKARIAEEIESVNALPFRAYVLIWNEWFRDQNLQTPAYIVRDDATQTGIAEGAYPGQVYLNSAGNMVTGTELDAALKGGIPLPVNKIHDYFTSCLPDAQKGTEVRIPTSNPVRNINGTASALDEVFNTPKWDGFAPVMPMIPNPEGPSALWVEPDQNGAMKSDTTFRQKLGNPASTVPTGFMAAPIVATGNTAINDDVKTMAPGTAQGASTENYGMYMANLFADVGSIMGSINDLRLAFAVQRLLEKDARGGTRYTEIVREHFGTTSPDSRLQRTELLGSRRIPINIDQVLQTSASDDVSPQGNTAAYSLTGHAGGMFTRSFTEHGYIIGLACIRTEHTYQQGTERFWNRKDRFDFYYPSLAYIGEQAVLQKEIYDQPSANVERLEQPFGYQEAWADYRYKPSRISGEFRSDYAQSLDSWHYGDDYSSVPTLSSAWLMETRVNIDRTIAVPTQSQFLCDIAFRVTSVRPMPIFSVPGLVDHN